MKKKTQKKTNPDGRLASLCYGGFGGSGRSDAGGERHRGAAQLCGASRTGTAGRGREGEKGEKGRERREGKEGKEGGMEGRRGKRNREGLRARARAR